MSNITRIKNTNNSRQDVASVDRYDKVFSEKSRNLHLVDLSGGNLCMTSSHNACYAD